MSCRDFARYDARLRELTSRRPDLTGTEWAELYGIVRRVLMAERHSIYGSIIGTPEELVQDYFQDKIFRHGSAAGTIEHTCALAHFYLQYLQRRVDKRRVDNQPGAADSAGREPAPVERIDAELARSALASWQGGETDAETVGILVDLAAHAVERQLQGRQTAAELALITELAEAFEQHLGMRLPAILGSALDFLSGSGPWADLAADAWWIRLYLRRHQCPEEDPCCPERSGPEALYRLADECRVPAYHRKAVKLGVAVPKGGDAAYAAFAKSYRGQWLTALGIPVDAAHRAEMAVALKIQCLAALSGQGPATDPCGRLLP
jgi:hypothetical protein